VSAEITRGTRADPRALDVLGEYKAARERGEWRRLMLPGADLRDADLSGLDLDESDLTGAVLDGARFVESSLVRSCLAGASLVGADFSYANLDRADLAGADAVAAAFTGATLRRSDLAGCRLQRADFSGADLSRANLYEANLTTADLSGALVAQADLRGAMLEDAVLAAVRGEPLFEQIPGPLSSAALAGWPAARFAGPELVGLANSYMRIQGWWVTERSSREGEGVDLMAQRDDEMAFIQVKAVAAPSSQLFSQSVRQLKRVAAGHPGALLILVMPGPVPEDIQDLARASQVSVLAVQVGKNTMHVEELPGSSDNHLRASA